MGAPVRTPALHCIRRYDLVMRQTIAGLIVLFCCVSLAAETYESRSEKFAVEIRTGVFGDESRYDVTVTDLATKKKFAFDPILAQRGERVEATKTDGDLELRVTITPLRESIVADLSATRGVLRSSLHTVWNAAPSMIRLNVEDVERVGGDVKPPIVISRVEPIYPDAARQERVSGIVIVETLVDKSGAVKDAIILKDLPHGMGLAALDAVKQWRFAPATRNGEPVDVLFNLTVNFKLR